MISSHSQYFKCNLQFSPKINNHQPYIRSPLGCENDFLMARHINHLLNRTEMNQNENAEPEEEEADTKIRKYKCNNEIALHCQKLFKVTAYPSVAQITILIHQIKRSTSTATLEIDEIRSTVLQWFRKRREYLSKKIYDICDDCMEEVWVVTCLHLEKSVEMGNNKDEVTYDLVIDKIISNEGLMYRIMGEAHLPMKSLENSLSFVRRKVKDYFTKLCSKA